MASKDESVEFIPPTGLACFPIDIGSDYYGALVQFPTPERIREAYFVAIIMPTSQTAPEHCEFFTLEFSKSQDGSKRTVFGKWSDGSHFNMGDGPAPEKEAFVEAISELLAGRNKIRGW